MGATKLVSLLVSACAAACGGDVLRVEGAPPGEGGIVDAKIGSSGAFGGSVSCASDLNCPMGWPCDPTSHSCVAEVMPADATSRGGEGSSGPSNKVPPMDAEGDALDEITVVEPDGATVTGVAYGYPVKFPSCNNSGLIQSAYIFAAPVDLPPMGTVQGLGLITEQSAVVTMALYGMAPAGLGLVIQTASTSISAGYNVIPTPPTALPPGNSGISYWIAVEFEETTTVCANGGGVEIWEGMEPYGTFPSIWFPAANPTSGQLNLFAVLN
jgi:hypothetical protein